MALKKCKDCGQEISKKAKACPKCGAPQGPKQYSLGKLIILILFGMFMYALFTSDHTTTSRSNAPVTKAPSKPPLEIQSWKCDKEHGYVFVRGEVKNVSGAKLQNVMAVGEFRTKSNELVKTEEALLEYNPVMPGQTSPFEAGGMDNPEISSCNVSFKYLMGEPVAYTVKGK